MRVSELIAPPYLEMHKDILERRHRTYFISGGRGSGKSSFASLEIAHGLASNHKVECVILRKVGETIADSVAAQMMWAFDQLGLSEDWAYKSERRLMENKRTGQRVLMRGVDNPTKSKGIKSILSGFEYIWFEELSEFKSMGEVRTVIQSVLRGHLVVSPICFFTYNPPSDPTHWLNNLPERDDAMSIHTDYTMVPAAWLGEAFLDEAERLRQSDEKAWLREYKGMVVGVEGAVFPNVEVREITQDELKRFARFVNGLDFGFSSDPDAFVRAAIDGGAIYILEEIYQAKQSIDALADGIKKLAKDEPVTCDSADPRMIDELRRRGIVARGARKGMGSVRHGIRWLAERKKIVIDPLRCPNAAKEFLTYAYERDATGSNMIEPPDKNNHLIDALRYATEYASTVKVARIFRKDKALSS